jgi:hypothetical protein
MKTFTSSILAGLAAASLSFSVAPAPAMATGGLGGILDVTAIVKDVCANLAANVSDFEQLVYAGPINAQDLDVLDLKGALTPIQVLSAWKAFTAPTNIASKNHLHDILNDMNVQVLEGGILNGADFLNGIDVNIEDIDGVVANLDDTYTLVDLL